MRWSKRGIKGAHRVQNLLTPSPPPVQILAINPPPPSPPPWIFQDFTIVYLISVDLVANTKSFSSSKKLIFSILCLIRNGPTNIYIPVFIISTHLAPAGCTCKCLCTSVSVRPRWSVYTLRRLTIHPSLIKWQSGESEQNPIIDAQITSLLYLSLGQNFV